MRSWSTRMLARAWCVPLIVGLMWAGAPSAGATEETARVPGAPTVSSVTARDGSVLVAWSAPQDPGSTPVDRYVIEAQPSGTTTSVDGATLKAAMSPLENGVSTSFTITASNAAGEGPPSATSEEVTPRGVARLVVRQQPAARVIYGARSKVKAALVTAAGGVPEQRVELWARPRASTRWRQVASGMTGRRGRVTLSAKLSASTLLRLRHPATIVAARDTSVRSVVVAKRVTVERGRTRTRVGMPVIVKGRVRPGQAAGSQIRLQQRVSGAWRKVASARMANRSRFRIRWEPQQKGRYVLRVIKDRDSRRATGKSRVWRHRVDPETTADIAKDILRNHRITLATVHVSGGGYQGSAEQNMIDIAHGRKARFSCHAGAPCGSTRVDKRLLEAIRDMGTRAKITVSEIAGGVHARGSAHYSGRGLDITWVDGRHVGWGSDYGVVVDRCRKHGASEVLTPSNDPYGGHHNHVHCAWG